MKIGYMALKTKQNLLTSLFKDFTPIIYFA